MPPPFSPHSAETQSIAALFSLVLVIAAVVFIVVVSGVVYTSVRYRSRGVSAIEPRQFFGSRKLEVLWTVVPLAIVTGLFIVTVRAMVLIDAPQDSTRSPDLVITGHQWWWEARYPNGVVVPWDIHIPASRRLRARIESADVVHDFWVPELARKMDAVPGRWSYIWLEADAPGIYIGTCSEFCGAQHAWMRFRVIADTRSSFDAWMKRQMQPSPEATGIAVDGARLFQSKKCADCHTVTGAGRSSGKGPSLAHLVTHEFLGGGISRNTPDALTLWLTDPQAAKPGNRMPDTPLSPGDRVALLAYLEGLR
ncbi:MAG: cytochrome c oxidase subunit II [Bryobacteraceae bacterium]